MDNVTERIYILDPSSGKLAEVLQKALGTPQTQNTNTPQTNKFNLDNVKDFSRVCRMCATVSDCLVPIFSGSGTHNNLPDKIHKHLTIKVSPGDSLPRSLCHQCADTLLAWHELVEYCRQADGALRTKLRQLQLQQSTQEAKPQSNAEGNKIDNTQQNECKPCRCIANTTAHDTNATLDGPQAKEDDNFNFTLESQSSGGHSDGNVSVSDEEDEPLSSIATKKSIDLYNNFYTALLNFRDHFVNEHKTRDSHRDVTDSSDSEMLPEQEDYEDDVNVDSFDDLTQSNMRKDRMDEETRVELNEVQTKINGKVYYTCRICGKNLSSSHTYVFHKRIHTGERPCVCHVCGKQFRAPNGLQRHLTETHERVRRHACRFCPKNFANSQNLKQHMRIHTGERPFVCPQCGKRFTQSGSLHVHLKTHSEQFPHQCAECGAKFRLRSGLARHRLKHTGERPHVCAHCGKGFRQKHELSSHSLSHTDAKPFSCAVCGAAFRLRRALTHHTKRLHETEQNRDASHAMTTRGPNMLIYAQIGQYQ